MSGQDDCWSLHHFSVGLSVFRYGVEEGVRLTSGGQRDGGRVDGLGRGEPDEAGEDYSDGGGREHLGLMS